MLAACSAPLECRMANCSQHAVPCFVMAPCTGLFISHSIPVPCLAVAPSNVDSAIRCSLQRFSSWRPLPTVGATLSTLLRGGRVDYVVGHSAPCFVVAPSNVGWNIVRSMQEPCSVVAPPSQGWPFLTAHAVPCFLGGRHRLWDRPRVIDSACPDEYRELISGRRRR